jgi:hypothetical protein
VCATLGWATAPTSRKDDGASLRVTCNGELCGLPVTPALKEDPTIYYFRLSDAGGELKIEVIRDTNYWAGIAVVDDIQLIDCR